MRRADDVLLAVDDAGLQVVEGEPRGGDHAARARRGDRVAQVVVLREAALQHGADAEHPLGDGARAGAPDAELDDVRLGPRQAQPDDVIWRRS